MAYQIRQTTKITIITLILLFLMIGCSKGKSDPITGNTNFETSGPGNLDTLPVIAFDGTTAIGVMGGYNLTIAPDYTTTDLTPMRSSSVGESYIVSGEAFFTMTPCNDCLKIDSIALDINSNIEIGFSVKHPFPKGNPSEDPSASNRLDLDVFDLAVVVKPLDAVPDVYSLAGIQIYAGVVPNADGYTQELSGVIGENSALPFKICYESENNNRFEMGTPYQPFDVTFSPDTGLTFDLYLTMGYGASAKKLDRLNPTYYVPEFNRKAAWKVEIDPVSWLLDNPSTVTIDIYDWNHGAPIDSNFPSPGNTASLPSSSDVQSVFIEVPGMTSAPVVAAIDDTSTNGWDDPLTYTATFTNENNIDSGLYTGLVKVVDSRTPGAAGASDSLVHTPDGGSDFEWHEIPEYATYQTFDAYLVTDDYIYHDDAIENYVMPGFEGLTAEVAARQLAIYFNDGEYNNVLSLIDNSNSYIVGQILDMNIIQVKVGTEINLVDEKIYFESNPSIIYAQPSFLVETASYPTGEPDSTLPEMADKRWHFDIIDAPEAWNITTGDSSVIVGIIDSGLDYDNYDDFAVGANKKGRIIQGLFEPSLVDYEGHGTHVAGIIGASGHNHNGTLGMAWDIKLHPFNVKNYFGFTLDFFAAGVILVNSGCNIINMSLGFSGMMLLCPDDLRDKLAAEIRYFNTPFYRYAALWDTVLIYAAGNSYMRTKLPSNTGEFYDDIPLGHFIRSLEWEWETNISDMEIFNQTFPNVLLVAGTDPVDNYYEHSNRGKVIQIAAPGYQIYSAYSSDAPDPNTENGFYVKDEGRAAFASGTSQAAPMVSGLAALILSVDPDLTAKETVDFILDYADPGPDADTGRINAYKSILDALPGDCTVLLDDFTDQSSFDKWEDILHKDNFFLQDGSLCYTGAGGVSWGEIQTDQINTVGTWKWRTKVTGNGSYSYRKIFFIYDHLTDSGYLIIHGEPGPGTQDRKWYIGKRINGNEVTLDTFESGVGYDLDVWRSVVVKRDVNGLINVYVDGDPTPILSAQDTEINISRKIKLRFQNTAFLYETKWIDDIYIPCS